MPFACDSQPLKRLVAADGHAVYVESQTMSISTSGRVLLLGNPTIHWTGKSSGDTAVFDTLPAGVVVETDGRVTLVPRPAPGTLDGYRAIRWGDEWAVVWASVDARDYHAHDDITALWFGITDGAHWHDVVRMAAPPGVTHAYRLSQLAHDSQRVAFVVPNERPRPGIVWRYDRSVRGRWDLTPLVAYQPMYADLDRGSAFSSYLAVVEPDSMPPGEMDTNSLLLYRHDANGVRTERTVFAHGGELATYDPAIATLGRALVVAYSVESASRPGLDGVVAVRDSTGTLSMRAIDRGRMAVRLVPFARDSLFAVAYDPWSDMPDPLDVSLVTPAGVSWSRTVPTPFKRQVVADSYGGLLAISGSLIPAANDTTERRIQSGVLEMTARCRSALPTQPAQSPNQPTRRNSRVEAIHLSPGASRSRRMR